MKLLLIRHCDPDYSIDSLTETGWKEAQALADRYEKAPADFCYVSPLGRARDTARVCLERTGQTAETCSWLREFNCPVKVPHKDSGKGIECAWDWLPSDWTARPAFYDPDRWLLEPELAQAGMEEYYSRVCRGLDALLEEHGYRRDGLLYRAERPGHSCLALFCHFGLECVLLSHLLHISPMVLWHGTCSAPSGVTTVVTEERAEGTASWRMSAFGDTSHLYAKGMEPSFHARFCECFTDETRH